MSKAFVVGLTGPMGSGKSYVAQLFKDNGYKVVDADVVARKVVEKGSPALEKLSGIFGEDILDADGVLDRRKLAQRAFSSKESTDALNRITHPAIIELVKKNISDFVSAGFTRIIYDAPLLFESESDALCDAVVSVIAPLHVRMDRVKKRDGLSENEINDRFKAQHDDNFYINKSDHVIYNSSSVKELEENTMNIISVLNEVENGTFCENR